jgi:hypothetical protein
MGRRSTVETLPDDQFEFVMQLLIDGATDREVEKSFSAEFPGCKVPKSSLNTWRNGSGDELVERYKVTRFLARSVVEKLKAEGVDVEDDRYKHVIEGIEDQLLTKTREIFSSDPLKLLYVRQEDEKLRIKREQIELNREKLTLERQKLLGATNDPIKQGTEFMTELFDYGKDDPEVVLFIKKHTKPFIESLHTKYAPAEG